MKIVCVGCSFTDGVVTEQPSYKHTYPYLLYKSFNNSTVYNLGVGSFSNFWIYKMMKDAIREINPDIIIRQITTPYRNGVYDVNKKWNLTQYIRHMEGSYLCLNKHDLYNDSLFLTPSAPKGKLYDNKIKQKIYNNFYKFTCPDIMLEMNEAVLLAGDQLLENKNSLTFSWFAKDARKDCLSIEKEIGFDQRYFCDPAGHFNAEGNEKVSEWVRKKIKDLI